MNKEWKDLWKIQVDEKRKAGGQGEVVRVENLQTGELAAAKFLHPEHLNNVERRYRMNQEVSALEVLQGHGVPLVLESNQMIWQEKGREMYAVMRWVEGLSYSSIGIFGLRLNETDFGWINSIAM